MPEVIARLDVKDPIRLGKEKRLGKAPRAHRITGVVMKFIAEKQYGVINLGQEVGKTIFVHSSKIIANWIGEDCGPYATLQRGETVEFEVGAGDRHGLQAYNGRLWGFLSRNGVKVMIMIIFMKIVMITSEYV
jgi:cold shock CspA family protein